MSVYIANESFCLSMKEHIYAYLNLKKKNEVVYYTDSTKEFYQNKDVLKKFIEMKHHAPFIANVAN